MAPPPAPDPRWPKFDVNAYCEAAGKKLDAFHADFSPYLAATRSGPVIGGASEAVVEAVGILSSVNAFTKLFIDHYYQLRETILALVDKERQFAWSVEVPNKTTVIRVPGKTDAPTRTPSNAEKQRVSMYATQLGGPAFFAAGVLGTIAFASASARRRMAMDHDLLNALGCLIFSNDTEIEIAWNPDLLRTRPAVKYLAFMEFYWVLLNLVCNAVSSLRGPSAPRLRRERSVRNAPFGYLDVVSKMLLHVAETRNDLPREAFERATYTADTIFHLQELSRKAYAGADGKDEKERPFAKLALKRFDDMVAESGSIGDNCDACQKEVDPPKRCGRCRTAFYCGSECQRRAWPSHKRKCVAVSLAQKVWSPAEKEDAEAAKKSSSE